MSCSGCYKENIEGYCLQCRKRLFDGKRVSHVLTFEAPKNENIKAYQDRTARLSISGAQLKYSLRLEDQKLVLTEDNGAYIIKPVPPAVKLAYPEQVPENEHLTMQIAAQIFKIETAANAVIYFAEQQPAYITRRFDVKADGSKHLQEDFAQLSGKTEKTHGDNFKYSGSYEDIGHLIRKYVAAYAPAMEVFFRLVVFNYLFSNGDAHLKNFSLMQSETGDYKLTPAYDLMSTIIHVPGETDTALDLFDGDIDTAYYRAYGHHGYPDFMEFARRLSVVETRAKRIVTDMLSHTDKVIVLIYKSLLSAEVKAKYLSSYMDKVRRLKQSAV